MKSVLSVLIALSIFLPMVSFSEIMFEKSKLITKRRNSTIENASITYFIKDQFIKIETPLLKETNNQIWLVSNPKVERLTDSGEKWSLSGNHAEIDAKTNKTKFFGKVIGKSNVKQLSSIECDELTIDDIKKVYYTSGKTLITTMNQLLTSNGIEYDLTKNQIRIPNYGKLVYIKE